MAENLRATALRIENRTLEYIDKISKLLHLDRSNAFRMILNEGIAADRKQRALEFYTKGKFTLEQAAKFSDMYIGEFLDLMREKGIESNVTLEMVRKGLKNLKSAK